MGNCTIVYKDKVLIDLSGDTVSPETLTEGVTAHDKNGDPIVGARPIGGEAGSSGGTQTVTIGNSRYSALACAYFSPNYPDWVTVTPGQTIVDQVPDGAVFGFIYDNDNLSANIFSAPKRTLFLRQGALSYPDVDFTANSVRMFVAQGGTSAEIFVQ